MKKALFTVIALLLSVRAFSQNIPPVDAVRLETSEDYRNADSLVSQVSSYLLSIPINKDNNTRFTAGLFLVRWMEGTPEFNFAFDQNVTRYFEKDVDLLSVYYSALASFAIHHPSVKDSKTITLNAVKDFIAYVNNPKYQVVPDKKLKKLLEADQKGALKSFLKL